MDVGGASKGIITVEGVRPEAQKPMKTAEESPGPSTCSATSFNSTLGVSPSVCPREESQLRVGE